MHIEMKATFGYSLFAFLQVFKRGQELLTVGSDSVMSVQKIAKFCAVVADTALSVTKNGKLLAVTSLPQTECLEMGFLYVHYQFNHHWL